MYCNNIPTFRNWYYFLAGMPAQQHPYMHWRNPSLSPSRYCDVFWAQMVHDSAHIGMRKKHDPLESCMNQHQTLTITWHLVIWCCITQLMQIRWQFHNKYEQVPYSYFTVGSCFSAWGGTLVPRSCPCSFCKSPPMHAWYWKDYTWKCSFSAVRYWKWSELVRVIGCVKTRRGRTWINWKEWHWNSIVVYGGLGWAGEQDFQCHPF